MKEDIVFTTPPSDTSSTHFSKTLLVLVMFILGIQAPLVLGAQFFGLTFKTLSIISLILILVTVVFFIFFSRSPVKKKDYDVLIALIILGILGSVLGLVTDRSDTDDYFYTANAVYYLNQPDESMTFEIHAFRGLTEDPVVSVGQGVSTPYDYFRAVLAYLTGIEYLDIYFNISLALIGFLVPVANFWMMSKFTEDTRLALLGTIMIFCVLLILTDTHRTFGNFAFPRIYQGKAVALTIGIPIYVALSLSYFSNPSIIRWLALSMTIMAVVGMSTSSALLFSILAAVLALAYFALAFPLFNQANDLLSLVKKLILYMLNIFYAVFFAVILVIQQRSNGSDSYTLPGPDSYLSHISHFINRDFPLTFMLLLLTLILFLIFKVGHKRFLSYWILALALFVANPLISYILIDTVIPRNIFWRVFYLGPFPLLIGVLFVHLVQRYEFIKKQALAITGIAMLLSIGYYSYHFSKLDQLHYPPTYKLPAEQLALSQRITEVAPEGVMLAPPEAYGIIPMLDAGHPQVRMREDGNRLWLGKDEGKIREQASLFVAGDNTYRASFFQLIDQGFTDVIVFTISPDEEVIKSLVDNYNYQPQIIENCCVLYFR